MKYFLTLILIPSLCFCDENYTHQLENKIENALPNIRMAQEYIIRAQSTCHIDPNKAADLCLNSLKFLWNAEQILKNKYNID